MADSPDSEKREQPVYGDGDTSFRAAGGVEGLRQLVDDFYDISLAQTRGILVSANIHEQVKNKLSLTFTLPVIWSLPTTAGR